MIKIDIKQVTKEYNDLMKMREIAIDKSIPYEKQKQIRDEQIKKYKKYKFMINLRDAVKKAGE